MKRPVDWLFWILVVALASIILFFLFGCAYSTVCYPNGRIALDTQADISGLVLLLRGDGGMEFRCATMNHSIPTRAGGSTIGTAGTAAIGLATAISTYGIIK